MNLEEAISSYLTALPTMWQLLRADANSPVRIYPDVAPQDSALPYVTTLVISDVPTHHTGGATGYAEASIQIDVWAISSASRRLVGDAIKNALDGACNVNFGALRVQSCRVTGRENSYEAPSNSSEVGYYRMRFTVELTFQETLPTLS